VTLVASFAGARCTGAPGIPRRSFSCGQRDPVEVVWFDLKLGREGYHVSNMRRIKVKRSGVERDQGEVLAHRKSATPAGSTCGGSCFPSGSLVAKILGFLGGRCVREGGVFIGVRER
jgi:hypothetical protein